MLETIQMNVNLFLAMTISQLNDLADMRETYFNSSQTYDGLVISRLIKISEDQRIPSAAYPMVCFGTGFIVFMFVTLHVFKDHSTHYALERDLMFNPPYEIGFQGANLMLNRRKKERILIRDNREGEMDPYVFICTTLWQENEQEMEALLRSLVRLASHLGRAFEFHHRFRFRIVKR